MMSRDDMSRRPVSRRAFLQGFAVLSAGQTTGRAVKARAKALGLSECSK